MAAQEGWKRAQLFSVYPTTTQPASLQCTPFTLPSDGIIEIAGTTVTLTANAVFTPQCTAVDSNQIATVDGGGVSSIADMRDPFHASITPQAYATGAATVIAWMLVIMLIITPRTFFVGGASGKSGLMGRRGLIGGASGGGSIIGVGTRPWLQKVAALTVAVSLTLATADTFKIAEQQYADGFMDAMKLRDEVVSGMEIKVSRVISDVFLWLAQVQTLIRLFPRHKEKVIIKWVGFALILLDITFSCLNSFGPYNDRGRPRHFETAIPALSYLFQLSLSMLYAAWVMYYAITKRRYAFYHSMMWNITLVAMLSFIAILTPVVFFITDISNYTIAGWGDYFRWVGAAAASVIVWEWVERIEALEREERKDGILGREIYDGDEMLDTTPSHEVWPQRHSYMSDNPKKPGDDRNSRGGATTSGHHSSNAFSNLAHRLGRSRKEQPKTNPIRKRTIHIPAPPLAHRRSDSAQPGERRSRSYLPIQSPRTPPPVIASPVSRADTASADSTVYTVRYHPVSDSPPTATQPVPIEDRSSEALAGHELHDLRTQLANVDPEKGIEITEDTTITPGRSRWHWQAVANPFRRRGHSPPPEVQRGRVIEPLAVDDVGANIPPRNYAGLALKDRLGTFAAQQGEKFRSRKHDRLPEKSLPVTIIPAQPRGRTWSPEILLSQQPEGVTDAAGIRITRDAPRSIPTSSENDTASVAQPGGFGSSLNHNSHVRFTQETFQRSATRQHDGTETSLIGPPRSSVGLGTEMRDPMAEFNFNPQSPSISPSIPEHDIDEHITSTNHDR